MYFILGLKHNLASVLENESTGTTYTRKWIDKVMDVGQKNRFDMDVGQKTDLTCKQKIMFAIYCISFWAWNTIWPLY